MVSIMSDVLMDTMETQYICVGQKSDRKRKREVKRSIRKQAKRRKLMKDEIMNMPSRTSYRPMLCFNRSVRCFRARPSKKASKDAKNSALEKSLSLPTPTIELLQSQKEMTYEDLKQNQILNEYLDMKTILEENSTIKESLRIVWNFVPLKSQPNKSSNGTTTNCPFSKQNMADLIPLANYAADYLKLIIQNNIKKDPTVPQELQDRFELTLKRVFDRYVRLNPRVRVNFAKPGFWNGRHITNCKDIPCSVTLKELIDEINDDWEGLREAVVSGKDVSNLVMVSVWVPGQIEEPDVLLTRIKIQNVDLNTDLWKLYHVVFIKTEKEEGQWMILGIDEKSRNMLILSGYWAKCGFKELNFVIPPFQKKTTDSDSESDYAKSNHSSDDEN